MQAAEKGAAARAAVVAFAAAFCALFVQVLVHRMVSAKLINNFAFLVISLTMLGFAASGVALTLWRRRAEESLDATLLMAASLFGPLLILASAIFYRAPFGEGWGVSRSGFIWAFLRCVPLSLLYALPFACCGIILGALLSHPRLEARRVYFFDLAGSALGAFAVIPAISWLGVETSALAGSAALLTTVSFVARPRGSSSPWWAAACSGLVILTTGLFEGRVFAMRYPPGTVLGMDHSGADGFGLERVVWDPVARIEVSRIPAPEPETVQWPFLIGSDASFHRRFRRILTQNNNAFTYAVDYDGRVDSLKGIEDTLYAAAYEASSRPSPRVLVIGVGGGFDVLTALRFGASRVTGVEVNAATLDLLRGAYRDYFRKWVSDPAVHLVHDDGRHFLAATQDRYDVIQLSGVDSASGTPAAAHVFSESYLYTSEAFDLYLSRLLDDGILNVMRSEWLPPREMLRALATAVASLRRAGVSHPAENIVTLSARNGLFTSLLVKRQPFTASEVSKLREWSDRQPFFAISSAVGMNERPANLYQYFLGLDNPAKEAAFLSVYPFDVRPVDDDRPFFFKYSRWDHVFTKDPIVAASVPFTEYGLVLLLLTTGVAVAACIYLPLWFLAGDGMRTHASGGYAVFFASTGLGYMAIEIALVQKFGLILGHPNYALSVVLAGLLVSTGVGSLWSVGLVRGVGGVRFVAYALAFLILAEERLLLPWLAGEGHLGFGLRVAAVFLLVAPVGILLGTFFPTGLEGLKGGAAAFAPWAWGINGIFSVLGPILSVAVSTTLGMGALLLMAIPVYLVAGWAVPPSSGRRGDAVVAGS